MGKVTWRLLLPSDPIFSEPLQRTHPLLERKKLDAMRQAVAATNDKEEPEAEEAARGPTTSRSDRDRAE